VAGGMESMSNIPFMLLGARQGFKYGDQKMVDGVSHDGLSDAYSRKAMVCARYCYSSTRTYN
jgi:acetyl-CoA C-acetyltransferase